MQDFCSTPDLPSQPLGWGLGISRSQKRLQKVTCTDQEPDHILRAKLLPQLTRVSLW